MPRRLSQKSSVPMIVKPSPVPMVIKPSIFSSIKDGFGFGIGSAVAHRAVDSMFRVSPLVPKKPENLAYEQCLAENADFIDSSSICAHHLIQAKEAK